MLWIGKENKFLDRNNKEDQAKEYDTISKVGFVEVGERSTLLPSGGSTLFHSMTGIYNA